MKTEQVATLMRKATEIIDLLQKEREPVLVIQHGKPAAYLLDVASVEQLTHRISVLEGLALGEQAARAGRTATQAQAKRRFSKWLK